MGDPPESTNHPEPGGLRSNWERTEGMDSIREGRDG
jgi:hypothetical protein